MNLDSHYVVLSQNIQHIAHPLVSDIYIKREYNQGKVEQCQDILIIETNFSAVASDYTTYNSLLSDLYLALPAIKDQVEDSIGPIDRVDIKTH